MLRSYGATLPYFIIVAVEKGGVVVVMGSGGSGFLVGCSSLFFFNLPGRLKSKRGK